MVRASLPSNNHAIVASVFHTLYKHIKRGRIEPIREFLDAGGDPNLAGGWTLLMTAAHFGQAKILTLLLDHGADIEGPSREGLTPLAFAASAGKRQCLQILIERGAKVNVRPHGTPLLLYVEYCGGPYPNVEKLLIAAGHRRETRIQKLFRDAHTECRFQVRRIQRFLRRVSTG